jgi:hypothetical protein
MRSGSIAYALGRIPVKDFPPIFQKAPSHRNSQIEDDHITRYRSRTRKILDPCPILGTLERDVTWNDNNGNPALADGMRHRGLQHSRHLRGTGNQLAPSRVGI